MAGADDVLCGPFVDIGQADHECWELVVLAATGCRPLLAPVPIGFAVQSLQLPAVTVVTDMVTLLVMRVVLLRMPEDVVEVAVSETIPVPDAVGPICGWLVPVPFAKGAVGEPVMLAKGITVRRLEETSKNEQTEVPQVTDTTLASRR